MGSHQSTAMIAARIAAGRVPLDGPVGAGAAA